MESWQSRFGGIRWRVTEQGVEVDRPDAFPPPNRPVLRTKGEPITARRVRQVWGDEIGRVSIVTGVPPAILMMTLMTEGALRWNGQGFDYPAYRKEPGYVDDRTTPGRISIGPMHILLSNYRSLMYAPKATREEAGIFRNNLLAGARYIASTYPLHLYDPILVAAVYNSGGVMDASNPKSKYHSPWHLVGYDHDGPEGPAEHHLTRAARWYGDAVTVLAEDPLPLRVPQLAIPAPMMAVVNA